MAKWAKLAMLQWKQRDGTKIRWGEMTPRHLRNCAAMVRRNAQANEDAYWSVGCMLQGDMATMIHDQGYSDIEIMNAKAEKLAKAMEDFALHLETKHREAA